MHATGDNLLSNKYSTTLVTERVKLLWYCEHCDAHLFNLFPVKCLPSAAEFVVFRECFVVFEAILLPLTHQRYVPYSAPFHDALLQCSLCSITTYKDTRRSFRLVSLYLICNPNILN